MKLELLLNVVRKIIPRTIFNFFQPFYHWFLVVAAAAWYGWPSNKLIIIGVTGTKGKSTTCYLLARILEATGHKVGVSSGIVFKIGEQEWLNDEKMTMIGRFKLQRLLRQMVKAGCRYAIVETTSEGIKQYRHRGINYDVVAFTNLYPEHIESHGSFTKYKQTKGKLLKHLTNKPTKKIFGKKISVINLDDAHAQYFIDFPADEKIGYTINEQRIPKDLPHWPAGKQLKIFKATDIQFQDDGVSYQISRYSDRNSTFAAGLNSRCKIHLFGKMNVYNSLAATVTAQALGFKLEQALAALAEIKAVPGRLEFIDGGQKFKVIVDYAHEPESLKQLFSTLAELRVKAHKSRTIHVFGATGGGRDKAKRPIMGRISDANSDIIVLTNDDPYQDDENQIINDIAAGVKNKNKITKIVERNRAITYALSVAAEKDIVVITGKGAEQTIILHNGKQAWDDRVIVRKILHHKLN